MNRRASPLLRLAPLLCLGVGLVAWHYLAARGGRLSAPEGGAFGLLRPVQRAFTLSGAWLSAVGRVMFGRDAMVRDNKKLRNQVDDLQSQNLRLARYRRENEELRRLLNMPRPEAGKTITADVLSLDATDNARRMILNVGAQQGVRAKDVVFTAHGVVGQIVAVAGQSSVVLLLTDRMSGVGAMTERTQARGVVRGEGGRVCQMQYLDFAADVREGDLILTSGESKIFPKGMVIGRVLRVDKDKTYSQTSAALAPAVPFDQISAVNVRVQAGP